MTITIPPLRERQADILPLTEMFIRRFSEEQGMEKPTLSSDLPAHLASYSWPGNVRQLRNAVYQGLTQLESGIFGPRDIALPGSEMTPVVAVDCLNGSLDEITKRYEASVLEMLYRDYPSTRKLAKRLNVSHTAIANKLREYGLSSKKEDE